MDNFLKTYFHFHIEFEFKVFCKTWCHLVHIYIHYTHTTDDKYMVLKLHSTINSRYVRIARKITNNTITLNCWYERTKMSIFTEILFALKHVFLQFECEPSEPIALLFLYTKAKCLQTHTKTIHSWFSFKISYIGKMRVCLRCVCIYFDFCIMPIRFFDGVRGGSSRISGRRCTTFFLFVYFRASPTLSFYSPLKQKKFILGSENSNLNALQLTMC